MLSIEYIRRSFMGGDLPPTSTSQGAKVPAWHDFQLIWVGALLLLLLIAFEAWLWFLSPLRLVLGLLYILYMPGYCLTAAFFPRADELDSIERTGVSLGLSIALVPLLALLLDWLPTGLRLWPILLTECAVMALCTVVALERRLHLRAKHAPKLSWRLPSWWRSLLPIERKIYQIVVGLLLATLIYTAWVFLVPSSDEFTTEFYILGPQGIAQNFPREAIPGEELSVTMGIINRERSEHTYRVEVWAIDPWQTERRELLSEIEQGVLSENNREESPITWSMPWAGKDQKVEFLLFIDDDPEPYRELRLWLDVVEPLGDF
ncbi:MAG: DUF1616 domain-containing protein [Ardenticatenaceae bacterium]